ncbi:MAG: lysophospholipid acyltransferase family protein [Planctomycetota bacterium]
MKHEPVVTRFKLRPFTYPDGHWMNRFWGPLARAAAQVIRLPFYRYILGAPPETRALLRGDAPVVFTCLHQDSLDCFNCLPRLFPGRRLTAMVSYSRDGGLAALGMRALGYDLVRGSSSHGGGEALLLLRSTLQSGASAVMACDGPLGPLGDVKPGVVLLAGTTGVPIVPVRCWGQVRYRLWHSWMQMALSLPGLPVTVRMGAPHRIPPGLGDSRPHQLALARCFETLAREASVWAGGPDRAPFTVAGE